MTYRDWKETHRRALLLTENAAFVLNKPSGSSVAGLFPLFHELLVGGDAIRIAVRLVLIGANIDANMAIFIAKARGFVASWYIDLPAFDAFGHDKVVT